MKCWNSWHFNLISRAESQTVSNSNFPRQILLLNRKHFIDLKHTACKSMYVFLFVTLYRSQRISILRSVFSKSIQVWTDRDLHYRVGIHWSLWDLVRDCVLLQLLSLWFTACIVEHNLLKFWYLFSISAITISVDHLWMCWFSCYCEVG